MNRALSLCRVGARMRSFHSSAYVAKIMIEKVPALGESITEGSIASWSKNVGDSVAVDDVIVIVETDKVTVDIKSTYAGVLTKKIAEENVIVGAPLYEIDVDATAAASSPSDETVKPTAPAVADSKTESAPEKVFEGHRKPLIHFLGKRDRTKKAAHTAQSTPASKPAAPSKPVKEGNGVHFTTLKGMGFFGRPQLSLKEMEAIESGGATTL